MKVYRVFSLESPYLGGSNKYTQYTIFNIKKSPKIILNLELWDFPEGLKNEFETALSVRATEVLLYLVSRLVSAVNQYPIHLETLPRGYKTFFILNLTEYDICPAHKC